MAIAGVVLLLLGFALVIPHGALSGSSAIRNVPMGFSHVERTPGYQEAPTGRARWIRLALGLVMMASGVVLIALA